MTPIRWLLLSVLFAAPAFAAEPVYPTGSRIGLSPPPGMTVSKGFVGFEDRDHNVAIIMLTLPPTAFAEIEKTTNAETLQKQGVTLETREEFPLPSGKALLIVGRQTVKEKNLHLRKWIMAASTPELTAVVTVQIPEGAQSAYPDATVRATLASLAVRESIPVTEQLSLLPFRMTELAGFKVGGLLAGRAVMLTDGANDAPPKDVDTHIVVAVAPGGPARASERDNFARDVFRTVPNLKDVRISTSEQLRISGQYGHQIMAQGKDARSGTDIKIVQWIRFGGGGYLHFVGVSRTDDWPAAYTRFRQVRDGVEAR
ncbi:MAG: hypothetical protein ACRECO_16915 [Xanthobacteraceae bacterium]